LIVITAYNRYSGVLNLRLSPELQARLARHAQEHHRSLEQEISYFLGQGVGRSA
jgi:predicted HicB family RNase H-like nuclease